MAVVMGRVPLAKTLRYFICKTKTILILPHEEIPVNSSINLWIILVYFLAPSFILAWPVLYMWVLSLFVNHTSHKQSIRCIGF